MASQKQSVHTIADCFIMNKEKFLIYGEYCSNLLQAQDLLDHVCNTVPLVQKRVVVCNACEVNSKFSLLQLREHGIATYYRAERILYMERRRL